MSDVLDREQERLLLHEYTERAYLDYSMYVINDRALPYLGDGLKPVQRRIVYAMSQLGLSHTAKFTKSARTVGDVIGKFHPHGDDACYRSMVNMAQEFTFRYPLVDGQGNWGAPDDPKSFAAQRYTESRLSRWAPLLLAEINEGTVDWVPNFDGTLEEPKFLPAQLPFLLLNGSMGIAVGMATNILPHNLGELVDACVLLLTRKSASLEEVMKCLPGPDFPTGGVITTPADELQRIYETGNGAVRARACYHRDDGDIVITELPYQSSPARILGEIAAQMNAKKLPMLADIRDESDHENPTRLVLVPRSNRVDVDRLMSHLFATTELEQTFKFNMNVIGLDHKPRVYSLLGVLKNWLKFRRQTVARKMRFQQARIERRLEILAGLLTAYENIDEVIRIVREEANPRERLMTQFELTQMQADAILELRLRQLARLEQTKLERERSELQEEKDQLEVTLSSDRRMTTHMKRQLQAIREQFADPRRSQFSSEDSAKAFAPEELLTNDPVTVVLSTKGWVRAARGHEIEPEQLPYRTGDEFLCALQARTNQACTFFDSSGQAFTCNVRDLPSARGQGEPLTGRFAPEVGVQFVGMVAIDDAEVLLYSDEGLAFIAPSRSLQSTKSKGKSVFAVRDGWELQAPVRIGDESMVASATSRGYLLVIRAAELPRQLRGSGVRVHGISKKLRDAREEYVVAVTVLGEDDKLVVHSGKKTPLVLRPKDLALYRGERGRRGALLPMRSRKVSSLAVERSKREAGLNLKLA